MVISPIDAICGVETNNFWILVESVSESNFLLPILLFPYFGLKFSPSAT